MLSVSAQDFYPYHIENLVSNDELYGSDQKFINEIEILSAHFVDEILVILKQLGNNQIKHQILIALELFQRVAINSDLSHNKMFVLGVNLWNLVIKNRNFVDKSLLVRENQFFILFTSS